MNGTMKRVATWIGIVAVMTVAAAVVGLAQMQGTSAQESQETPATPGTPANLTAAMVQTGVELSWGAPDGDVTGYSILRRRPKEGENQLLVYVSDTGSTATTWTDTGVDDGKEYVYRVKALNSSGPGPQSNFVKLVYQDPALVLSAPGNLSGESTADGIRLQWEASTGEVTGYRVLRRMPKEGQETLTVYKSDTGSTATTWTDTGVDDGKEYVYRVTAINSSGPGPQSNFVKLVYQDPASERPTNLAITEGPNGVTLSWTAPSSDSAEGYRIFRRKPRECQPNLLVYEANTGSKATTYLDSDVEHNVSYVYRVAGVDADGNVSDVSNFARLQYVIPAYRTDPKGPEMVDGFNAAGTPDGVELTWVAPEGEVTGYQIMRRSLNAAACQTSMRVYVPNTGSTDTTWVDTNVERFDTYEYQVKAINEHGPGQQSLVVQQMQGYAYIVTALFGGEVNAAPGQPAPYVLSIGNLDRDDDEDTVDYVLRLDVINSETSEDADACEHTNLGFDIPITVVDEQTESWDLRLGGSGCGEGTYSVKVNVADKDGEAVVDGTFDEAATVGG